MTHFRIWAGLFCSLTIFGAAVSAQDPPPFRLQQGYFTGLTSPVLLTHAKDGTRRTFILQQGGIIRVAEPGSTTTSIFMNITTRVLSGGERGLLGLAFHPQFATNSYFFVNYTRQTDGATVISRFRATDNNTIGDPNSERIVLTIGQPFSNHNGGMIEFREDSPGEYNLYIGMGDGGSGNDPGSRSQNINELLGKFLRIRPDVSGVDTNPTYTNPPDNPYVGVAGADEIYAIGVRNPWRWSIDRGGMNLLWAGDVGQNAIEEVSTITRGGNFGWRVYEGTQCTGLDPQLCSTGQNPITHIPPVVQYNHSAGRCSVTGGYVYRGVQNALRKGAYVYGDYCTGEIWKWENNQQTLLLDTSRNISSFGEDEAGELYVVGHGGTIDRILGNKTSADFGGDFRTDLSVFRPSTGTWFVKDSRTQAVAIQHFGLPGDIPAAKDYDGDFRTDIAVFRPSDGIWYYLRSSDSTFTAIQFGMDGDIPAAGDYNGDGMADFVVFRPSTSVWYRLNSGSFSVEITNFGLTGDIPTPGDFDGDGRYDIAVWRPSNGFWYRLNSTTGSFFSAPFGQQNDIPVQGDFDGDLRNDLSVFRPSNGLWYILRSSNNQVSFIPWGVNGDVPVVGDYDGDFIDDVAVFRPTSSVWYVLRSSNSTALIEQFGADGDLPIPSFDKP